MNDGEHTSKAIASKHAHSPHPHPPHPPLSSQPCSSATLGSHAAGPGDPTPYASVSVARIHVPPSITAARSPAAASAAPASAATAAANPSPAEPGMPPSAFAEMTISQVPRGPARKLQAGQVPGSSASALTDTRGATRQTSGPPPPPPRPANLQLTHPRPNLTAARHTTQLPLAVSPDDSAAQEESLPRAQTMDTTHHVYGVMQSAGSSDSVTMPR